MDKELEGQVEAALRRFKLIRPGYEKYLAARREEVAMRRREIRLITCDEVKIISSE